MVSYVLFRNEKKQTKLVHFTNNESLGETWSNQNRQSTQSNNEDVFILNMFARAPGARSIASRFLSRIKRTATQQSSQRRFVHVEKRLEELGITLPKAAGPRANYDVICHDEDANVMYVSGHLPFQQDGTLMTGKLTGEEGKDVDYGYQAARNAALNIVATLQDRLDGDLDQVAKIQKVFGIVQSSEDFQHQHLVMDGASDVLMEIFGKDVGYHARSAIGTST